MASTEGQAVRKDCQEYNVLLGRLGARIAKPGSNCPKVCSPKLSSGKLCIGTQDESLDEPHPSMLGVSPNSSCVASPIVMVKNTFIDLQASAADKRRYFKSCSTPWELRPMTPMPEDDELSTDHAVQFEVGMERFCEEEIFMTNLLTGESLPPCSMDSSLLIGESLPPCSMDSSLDNSDGSAKTMLAPSMKIRNTFVEFEEDDSSPQPEIFKTKSLPWKSAPPHVPTLKTLEEDEAGCRCGDNMVVTFTDEMQFLCSDSMEQTSSDLVPTSSGDSDWKCLPRVSSGISMASRPTYAASVVTRKSRAESGGSFSSASCSNADLTFHEFEENATANEDYTCKHDSSTPAEGKNSTRCPRVISLEFRQPSKSIGAASHVLGQCKPCMWYWRPDGCSHGTECLHCHLCPDGEVQFRRKDRRAMTRQKNAKGRSLRLAALI